MKWFVLILFSAALAGDIYIYSSHICRRFRHAAARIAYIIFAILTDGAALTALTLYGAAADRGHTGVLVVMWSVWLFFLTLVPKLFYVLGSVLDLSVNRIARRRVALFRWIAMVPAAALMVAMVCGATAGRTKLRVVETEVCSDRVPSAFDGYRIVHFSDLHIGTMMRPEKQLAALAEQILALGGDMVVNTGDLVNLTHDELSPQIAAQLGRLSSPDGVWTVWGNHDLGFYIKEGVELTPQENLEALSEKVRGMGWRILSDSSTWIRRGADSLLLTGIDYPHDPMLNSHNESLAGADISAAFEGVEGDPFNVVLCHTPKLWGDITALDRGDVTLSGHVHAMQAKFRLFGSEWSPAQYMYDYWSGMYFVEKKDKKRSLYVNDGIGCVGYPMRIGGARGEITVIKLKRCE